MFRMQVCADQNNAYASMWAAGEMLNMKYHKYTAFLQNTETTNRGHDPTPTRLRALRSAGEARRALACELLEKKASHSNLSSCLLSAHSAVGTTKPMKDQLASWCNG